MAMIFGAGLGPDFSVKLHVLLSELAQQKAKSKSEAGQCDGCELFSGPIV